MISLISRRGILPLLYPEGDGLDAGGSTPHSIRHDGRMNRASVSEFWGDRGILKLMGWNPCQVKQISEKPIHFAAQPGAQHNYDRTRTGWLIVRIMCLSGTLGDGSQGPGLLVGQHYKVTVNVHCHKSVPMLI